MIDIHQHFLWGLDDGADSAAEMRKMLLEAADSGISHLFATVHVRPGREHFRAETYCERLQEAEDFIAKKKLGITVCPGAEILYSSKALPYLDEGRIPTMNGTRFILVEFYPDEDFSSIRGALRALLNGGYKPILAHTERYVCMEKDTVKKLEDLKYDGAKLQVNSGAVLQSSRLFGNPFPGKLLKSGMIDYVASDAHGAKKRPNTLKEAYPVTVKKLGKEKAEKLFSGNQKRDLFLEKWS